MNEQKTLLSALMPKTGKWLDIGVGIPHHGIFDFLLSCGDYEKVVGIDCWLPAIEARQKQHPQLQFLCTRVEDYDFPELFDVITTLHVLEHLTEQAAEEVLRRAGCVGRLVVVETPNKFESGAGAAKEMGNPYQTHQFLVTDAWMNKRGFALYGLYGVNHIYTR